MLYSDLAKCSIKPPGTSSPKQRNQVSSTLWQFYIDAQAQNYFPLKLANISCVELSPLGRLYYFNLSSYSLRNMAACLSRFHTALIATCQYHHFMHLCRCDTQPVIWLHSMHWRERWWNFSSAGPWPMGARTVPRFPWATHTASGYVKWWYRPVAIGSAWMWLHVKDTCIQGVDTASIPCSLSQRRYPSTAVIYSYIYLY